MAGRRVLDVSKLVSATRHIAKAHLDLRSRQYDVFAKTSTLAKAAKNQTDRVTVTLSAAIAIAQRLAEEPINSGTTGPQTHGTDGSASPRGQASTGERPKDASGINQDHHYQPSEKNAAFEPAPISDLKPSQEQAGRHALPDGTIPSEGLDAREETAGYDTYGRIPATETAKSPLEDQRTKVVIPQRSSAVQRSEDGSINADTFGTASADTQKAVLEDTAAEEIPEGIDINVFRTTRGKTLLGSSKPSQEPKSTATQIDAAPDDIQQLAKAIAEDPIAEDPITQPSTTPQP
ncbi:hypothetical protein P152DRAFT_482573, partial [Eremomyces bilateralis CBS 781.70]